MLQRVVLGQVRFNLPGLVADGRGVAAGKQLVVRFGAIDRLVAFLRVLSGEQSLDDLQPGLRIVYARGGAGTREAIVVMPAASPGLGDVVAHAARLAGGHTFTGTGKHFVQFRDARAPLGYDVDALADGAGDLILYGEEQTQPYRIESELPLAKLLLRLSLVHVHGKAALAPVSTLYVTARRGLGTVLAGYLYRAATRAAKADGNSGRDAASAARLRASAALCESAGTGAFTLASAFWLFRIDQLPPRMLGLLTTTPGLDLYVPITDNVAVAVGYRHPIHLEACRGSFPLDRLYLFSPTGVTEVSPVPALAAIEDVVRIRVPAAVAGGAGPSQGPGVRRVDEAGLRPAESVAGGAGPSQGPGVRRAAASPRPDLAVTLRLEPTGTAQGAPPVAALIPWAQLPWLRRLVYALPPAVLRACRVVFLERGVLVRAGEALEGFPFGTLLYAAAPDVLVPIGMAIRPAVAPALVAARLGADGGALVVFAARGERPLRIPADAVLPLEPELLARVDAAPADVARADAASAPASAAVEIENAPLGVMPLWGLGRGR